VELLIQPEPDPADREALELALARLLEPMQPPPAYVSAWRRAGIAENLDEG
jgi:hypothetical protein